MQRGRVGDDLRLQGQVAAGKHDGGAVVADSARADDHVARRYPGGVEVPAWRYQADARGGDVHAVRRAVVDDLGVAGDDRNPGGRGRLRHIGDDLSQRIDGKALLQNETRRKGERAGAHDGEVIDGAVHGQVAGRSAREAKWLDHERVGA